MTTHTQPEKTRLIEIDLSDVELTSSMTTHDDRATAAAFVYERFVPYADEGWEWVKHPASPNFDGWVYSERNGERQITAARIMCRRVADTTTEGRPSHGLSTHRTRQLTTRSWTAEPGSKVWRPIQHVS